MDCSQKSFIILVVWRRHQLLSRSLPNGSLSRVSHRLWREPFTLPSYTGWATFGGWCGGNQPRFLGHSKCCRSLVQFLAWKLSSPAIHTTNLLGSLCETCVSWVCVWNCYCSFRYESSCITKSTVLAHFNRRCTIVYTRNSSHTGNWNRVYSSLHRRTIR